MKKKSSSNSQALQTNAQSRRENTHCCGGAAKIKTGALEGIALRVIMSDIPKYKTSENTLENTAAAKSAGKKTAKNE
jgi:hypothetical protein